MEIKYGGRLPDWRYRSFYRAPETGGRGRHDEFEGEAAARLASLGLPWCFGEMDYPHWRRIPVAEGDSRSVCYYAGEDLCARETALSRLMLCSRCPVFERCHKVTMAKKSVSPSLSPARSRTHMLAALSIMH